MYTAHEHHEPIIVRKIPIFWRYYAEILGKTGGFVL